jgi:hypothetical protein
VDGRFYTANQSVLIYLFVFLLTIFDAICTAFGISHGYITEGNPVVSWFMDKSVWGTCIGAIVIVGLILYWISQQDYKWIRYAMIPVLIVKIGIAGMHIYWMSFI